MNQELKRRFAQIFESDYRDYKSFNEGVLKPIFGQSFVEQPIPEDYLRNAVNTKSAEEADIIAVKKIGEVHLSPYIEVFDITISNGEHDKIAKSRVQIQNFIRKELSYDTQAFIIFHYEHTENHSWRFSYLYKGMSQGESTSAKRFTYRFGNNCRCRTASERFAILADSEKNFDKIQSAFSVQQLSDDFFNEYKEHYLDFVQYITGKRNLKVDNKWVDVSITEPNEHFYAAFNQDDKRVRDYVKKMMGRLVFLCFLQRKGWMGNGDMQYMQNLYKNSTDDIKADFLDSVLEPMFFGLLNTKPEERADKFKKEGWNINLIADANKIPYLNGGLFEQDCDDAEESVFPCQLFSNEDASEVEKKYGKNDNYDYSLKRGLLDFFAAYNFTIDENDPEDSEVGVDPEMLSRIFENLLEDNKDKGAFYTPKEIVQYMCRESLIAYLQTDKEEEVKSAIRDFVTTHNPTAVDGKDSALAQQILADLKRVKICDPAIGSGAFPMGLLNELLRCREVLEELTEERGAVKREIIQNNIYGVDIEKGAVDIARLRFWLSIIVDEKTPHALPNMDFKIMQGNSLLEQYEIDEKHSITLNDIVEKNQKHVQIANNMSPLFKGQNILTDLAQTLRDYYSITDHEQKLIAKANIDDCVRQYIKTKIHRTYRKSSQIVQRSAALNKLDNTQLINEEFFLWHTWFNDVFEQGGFDIVIGNPPYIRHEKLDIEYKRLLCSVYQNVGEGTADILVYFFGLGINILSRKGILNFITSNKFLKTKYGKSLRNTLASDVDVLSFIDFFELPVFNNASTDAGITLLRNDIPTSETKYYPVLSLKNLDLDALTKGAYQHTIKTETEWQFVRPEECSILNKLNENSISLTDFVNNRIYSGVKTGLNGTFMLTKEVRDMILSKCLSEDEYNRTDNVIKKAFRSRDIRKYVYRGPQIWLLFIPWHFPLPFEEAEDMKPQIALELAEQKMREDYPSLYSYLCDNKKNLSGRNKDETGIRYEWYALQRWGAKYYWEFDEEKLIYIHTAKNHEFYYDTEKHYVNNSCYIIASQSKFLYCFLNSKLFNYFKRIKFVAYGNGAEAGRCKLDGNKMATVPIRIGVDESLFKEKFERIQSLIKSNPQADTTALEREIDRLVYDLYGLTEDEIRIVEGAKL